MRLPWLLVVVAACEPAEPDVAAPEIAPDAPEVEAIRSTSTANDPPPPKAAPVDPSLAGLRTTTKRWFLALSREDRHIVRAACRARAQNPCWMVRKVDDDRASMFLPLGFEQEEHMDTFCRTTLGNGRGCMTPLVVSFDDAPVDFAAATHRFVFRDEPVLTEWPTAETPWIAIDRDGDGAITSGAELFGDATAWGDLGTKPPTHGFAALARLDANRDGVIDHDDPAFAQLVLWADTNADRKSSPDELRPLASAIVSIPLAHLLDPRCSGANCEGERGTAVLRDGRTAAVIDVYLGEH